MTYEDRISIPTPEGVELELVLAGLGSRLVATLVDLLIKGAVIVALWVIAAAAGSAGTTRISKNVMISRPKSDGIAVSTRRRTKRSTSPSYPAKLIQRTSQPLPTGQ